MSRDKPITNETFINLAKFILICLAACATVYIFSSGVPDIYNINFNKYTTTNTTHTSQTQETFSLNPLIFTISNNGFLPFIKNWILHLQQVQLNNFRVICTDKQCYDDLIHWNGTIFNKAQIMLLQMNDLNPKYLKFGKQDYKHYVKQRPKIVRWFYKQMYDEFINSSLPQINKTNSILYLDADIAVIENIHESFEKNNFSKFDMVFQYDSNEVNCSNITRNIEKKKQVCSCMILIPFKPENSTNSNIVKFIDEWDRLSDPNNGYKIAHDQQALNYVINNKSMSSMDIGYFNCKEYPTGWHIQHANWASNSLSNQSDHSIKLLHSNFIGGFDRKVEFFKKLDEWKVMN